MVTLRSTGVELSPADIAAMAEPEPAAIVEHADLMPRNTVTGVAYKGGNIMRLLVAEAEHGYGSGGWAGYNQWQTVGRQVRKHEKATYIATVGSKRQDDGSVKTFPGKPRRVFHFDQTTEAEESAS